MPPQAKQTCPNCGGTSELYNALHKSKLLLSNPGMHALFQDLKEAAKKLSMACNSQPCSLQRKRLTLEFQRAIMMESVQQHSHLYRYCSRREGIEKTRRGRNSTVTSSPYRTGTLQLGNANPNPTGAAQHCFAEQIEFAPEQPASLLHSRDIFQ